MQQPLVSVLILSASDIRTSPYRISKSTSSPGSPSCWLAQHCEIRNLELLLCPSITVIMPEIRGTLVAIWGPWHITALLGANWVHLLEWVHDVQVAHNFPLAGGEDIIPQGVLLFQVLQSLLHLISSDLGSSSAGLAQQDSGFYTYHIW